MSRISSRNIWGFAFYDFANSAYILVVHAFLFPIVFKEVVFKSSPQSDFYWGLAIASSVLLALLAGPLFGHRSDVGNRKRILATSIIAAFVGLMILSFPVSKGEPTVYFILFLLVNGCFVLSQIIYDSFLPQLSTKRNSSVVSGLSWGFGYLGGVLCLVLIYLLGGSELESSSTGLSVTAIFYIFFSTVALLLLPKSVRTRSVQSFSSAIRQAKVTKLLMPLIGIWLINEAIDVFIFFGPLFARSTFELSVRTVGIYLLIIQLIAFPATWAFGWLGKKIGILRSVAISILIWVVVAIGASVSQDPSQLLIVAIMGALVIGSTQALLRAYYSDLSERQHAGLSFGFYSIAARSSAVIGPLTYGVISFTTGNPRIAMALCVLPFLAGLAILFVHQKRITSSSVSTVS